MRPSRITASTCMSSCMVVIALAISGCDDDEPRRGFDSDIRFPEAQALIERGVRRIDLEVSPQGASSLAHLVEVEHDSELLDTELIEAEVLDFAELEDRGACRGRLVLAVPGVEVRFDSAVTQFGGLEDAPGCTAFIEHVGRRLAEGGRVRVEARRRPARVPHDPDDATFFADAIILTGERLSDEDAGDSLAAIELNVGPESLGLCGALVDPPSDCSGVLTLLGADVIARHDVTEVEAEDPTELLYFDVEERVVQVDENGRALILEDGTILRVVDGTRLEGGLGFGEVEQRLIAGERVVVEGDAVLSASAPTSLIGIELALDATDDLGDDIDEVAPRPIALSARVTDVAPELGLLVLPFETDVRVDAMTIVEGDFASLEELDLAIAAGAPVRAEVLGVMEVLEPRGVVLADRLTLHRAGQAA